MRSFEIDIVFLKFLELRRIKGHFISKNLVKFKQMNKLKTGNSHPRIYHCKVNRVRDKRKKKERWKKMKTVTAKVVNRVYSGIYLNQWRNTGAKNNWLDWRNKDLSTFTCNNFRINNRYRYGRG